LTTGEPPDHHAGENHVLVASGGWWSAGVLSALEGIIGRPPTRTRNRMHGPRSLERVGVPPAKYNGTVSDIALVGLPLGLTGLRGNRVVVQPRLEGQLYTTSSLCQPPQRTAFSAVTFPTRIRLSIVWRDMPPPLPTSDAGGPCLATGVGTHLGNRKKRIAMCLSINGWS
jgi:hypothetical protein